MADKQANHPNGKHAIRFREQDHSYIDNMDSRYVSVTTFIKKFFPQFDTVRMAKKCAMSQNPRYANRDHREIMQEWAIEGKRGSSEGTNVHEYAEFSLVSPDKCPEPISDRCVKLFSQVDKIILKFVEKGFRIITAEMIVFSPSLRISGTIDLLLFDPATNEMIILDWKQNKDPMSTINIYGKYAFPPIDHLQDTDINQYSLQLSLYQYIMEIENYYPDVSGYRRALIHLTPESAEPIKLDYYEYEIKEMLKGVI